MFDATETATALVNGWLFELWSQVQTLDVRGLAHVRVAYWDDRVAFAVRVPPHQWDDGRFYHESKGQRYGVYLGLAEVEVQAAGAREPTQWIMHRASGHCEQLRSLWRY